MPFAIEDFHSLVRLLEQHPEWRAELRRLVLSEELLTLPQLMRELSEKVRELVEAQRRTEGGLFEFQQGTEQRFAQLGQAQQQLLEAQRRTDQQLFEFQQRTEQRFAELAEFQRRTEERLAELVEAQRRTQAQVAELAEAQRRTQAQVAELAEAQRRTQAQVAELAEAQRRTERTVEREVGTLKGRDLERSYRERATSYFQSLLRRIRLVAHQELGHMLDDAVDAGRITLEEKAEVLECDVVVAGQHDGDKVYLVAEVSWVVDPDDVRRASRRAALLEKALAVRTLAAAAGREATEGARREAAAAGVWLVLDGAVQAP